MTSQIRPIDISLRDLVSLPAFGNMQLDGTKVIGFCNEAAPVLQRLFDMTIVKIGDNMRVRMWEQDMWGKYVGREN